MNGLAHTPWWVRASRSLIRRLPAGRYRAMNAVVRGMRLLGCGARPFVTQGAGFRFVCDLTDSIAREVCYTGRYELLETAVLQAILRPGMTFLDVGANWGYFTLVGAACVGERGRVVSFEPDPRLFALLQANVAQNGWQNATPLQLAAAAEAGTLTLAGFDEHGGNWGLSRLVEHATPGTTTFVVPTAALDPTLDQYGVGDVDLLKMDIEGAEDLALRGMADGLARGRYRRMLLELHPTLLADRGRTTADALEPLLRAGYRGWWIDHSPAAVRKASYSGSLRLAEFLQPVNGAARTDAWPHLLWLAPGLELPAHA